MTLSALPVLLIAVGIVLFTPTRALAADSPMAIIDGGTADNGHNYSWTIRNQHSSEIVRVTLPHYGATVFGVPDGWSPECTFLLEVGSKDKPGICTAQPASPGAGIQPGAEATFTLRVWRDGTQRGRGVVSVWFADGTTTAVPGVELPVREALGDKYISLVGLGAIFLIWLTFQAIRRRRTRHSISHEP